MSAAPDENVSFAFDAIQSVASVPGNDITTYWTVARDSVNKKYYYKTMGDMNIKVVDLKKIDFSKLKREHRKFKKDNEKM